MATDFNVYAWRPINIEANISEEVLEKLILVCGKSFKIRKSNTPEINLIEVYCGDDTEFSDLITKVHQALADIKLRMIINSKSQEYISCLVDRILMNALKVK